MLVILACLKLNSLLADSAPATPSLSLLESLIDRQKDIRTVSADFTQTRTLRTLRYPLVIKGRLWFQSPDQFRWELGIPPKTIVIGNSDGLTVIQPGKKQALTKPISTFASFPSAGSFGLIYLSGNGNLEEFQKRMQVLALSTSGSIAQLIMLPRDAEAARGLDSIRLDFNTLTGAWISLEIVTRDGSSIQNEFSNVVINPALKEGLFDCSLKGFSLTHENN